MDNKEIARIVKMREYFSCDICGKTKLAKMYEYQNVSYVRGYTPPFLKKVCGDCIYKECYGTNFYKKKKKEGTLDVMWEMLS